MKWTMQFTGGEELAERLSQLPLALSLKVRIDALKQAAEPIRSKAQSIAPRSALAPPHMQDYIVVQAVTRIGSTSGGKWEQREGEAWVAVGPAKQFFYGIFPEYGTVHQRAQPFMRPAFDSGAPAALPILSAALWDALRKSLPGSFATPAATGPTEVFRSAA